MSQPLDLDEARTVLADNGIDGPDLPYNPRALHAMRIADALLAEVERLHMLAGTEDAELIEDVAGLLWRIEGNYNREGSGPGSRFEGQRCEVVQARAVIRRAREAFLGEATS